MVDPRIWTPRPGRNAGARRRDQAPRSIAELEGDIRGPAPGFEDHGPGCDCGSIDCPYWRGEEAARIYNRKSEAEKRELGREAAELLKGYFGDA